jgi:hypothetical protein
MATYYTLEGVEYAFTNCITCGVRYAIPRRLYDHQMNNGGYHDCPNGHSQGWDKKQETELAQLKKKVERLASQANCARRRADTAERSITAYKGALTKLKRKAQAPVLTAIDGGKK